MSQQPRASRCAFLFLLLTAVGSPSYADLLPSIWYEFGFDPDHFPIASGCQPDDPAGVPCRPGIGTVNLDAPPWTFVSPTAVDFTITDGFLAGDSFDVLDFGVLVDSTPSVPLSGHSCALDPRICVVDPEMSHDSFLLPAGSHSITVSVNAAQILGEGFFQFEPVPEPSNRSAAYRRPVHNLVCHTWFSSLYIGTVVKVGMWENPAIRPLPRRFW